MKSIRYILISLLSLSFLISNAQGSKIILGKDTLSHSHQSSNGGEWWQIFGYPELNMITELALSENQSIKIGKNRVEASRARVRYNKSFLFPSVSINPSFYRQEFPANRPMQFDIDAQSVITNTYAIPVDLSYEVDITGKIGNQVKASDYQMQASNASQDALELSIAARVARNFAMLLTLDAESEILQRTRQSRQENLDIIEDRYHAGIANEIDYQRAKTELSSVNVQLKSSQRQRRDVELSLAFLTGQPADSFKIANTEIKYLAPQSESLYLTEFSKRKRPDIQAAEYTVESYKNDLKSARKDLYPSLYLDGSIGLLSGSSEEIFENGSQSWLVGGRLAIPLFEGGRRRAQLAISEYQLQEVQEQLNQQKILASQEIEQALSDLRRINEQLDVQQEFLHASQKAAELSRERYRKGLVTYLEVVDADRVVLEAEKLLVQLLGQQMISTINLIEAKGGVIEEI